MAAYAAVISLKYTINGLLNSSRVSPVSSTREFLESAYNWATYMQQVLERLDDTSRSRSSHENLGAIEGQIRDCAHKLEDVLEFFELNSDEDEEVITREITSIGEAVKKMEKDYTDELSRDDKDDEDEDDAATSGVSRIIDSGMKMVGNSTLFTQVRDRLTWRMRPDELMFFSLLGKEGSGCKMVSKQIFEYARNAIMFDFCVWVKVGPKLHELKQVVMHIIAQLLDCDKNLVEDDDELLLLKDEDELGEYLHKLLDDRRYMIVLVDVVDVELVNYLQRKLPDQNTGSAVVITTSSEEVRKSTDYFIRNKSPPGYFDLRKWFAIRHLLFGRESISEEMEDAGKKIVQNCRGTYLSVAKTLLFLLKSDKTVEEWSKIAADEQNPIFTVADEISEIREIKIEMQNYESAIVEQIRCWIDWTSLAKRLKRRMHPERFFSKMQIISFFGMAGIGKTTFVKKLSQDRAILSHFDHHVWITLGPKYQTEDILLHILAQIYPDIHKLHMKEDVELVTELCVPLSCKRCLIVLDDLCSKEPLFHLKNLLPNIRGTTMVTTRLPKVAQFGKDDECLEIELLDEEKSWCLLRQKVFAGGLCPPELEKAGHKIAEKCDGLPLVILAVADQLLKVNMSQEYWNDVASGKEKSVFKNAHQLISKALLPSYQRLPQHLKPCFLYLGVFLEKNVISTSKLTNLWISEGFLEPDSSQMAEEFVAECLCELVDRSLVMVLSKTCRLHSVFWHLSNTLAVKNKFYHAMNTYDDCSIEKMERQRRLSIRNSVLLGLKYVQNSISSNTGAHSLLCVGPFQQYPVPLNFELRLLRVMDAITIRLYEFPIDLVRLVHLRYLGTTCNGELPSSISNIWKLKYLVVERYMKIKSSKNSSLVPVEIWDLKELKLLRIMGGCLPNHRDGAGLLKLSTLLDVSAESCREEVLKWIPNLKTLGIVIELAPGDDEGNFNSFRCLNNMSLLDKLESLNCVVVNPRIRSDLVSPPAPLSMFPPSLKKLSLSGMGYPWEYMSIIGELENLEVLELKNYAFQGPKWEMDYNSPFKRLKFLLIEDTNLVQWTLKCRIPMKLEYLCIKHCYKLKHLPIALPIINLKNTEIVDCSLSTVTWAKGLAIESPGRSRNVKVYRSWLADT